MGFEDKLTKLDERDRGAKGFLPSFFFSNSKSISITDLNILAFFPFEFALAVSYKEDWRSLEIFESMEEAKTVSVFQLNTFLLPGWVSYSKNSNNSLCIKQDWRAKEIGKTAKEFDMVFLQEMWGSNSAVVEAELSVTHNIPQIHQSFSILSFKHTAFDVLKNYWNATGGS